MHRKGKDKNDRQEEIIVPKSKTLCILLLCLFLALAACGRGDANNGEYMPTPDNHVLTVLAQRDLADFIRYAETSMAQTREAQGLDFSIELTTYDIAQAEEQRLRLGTMLMAGQGYDLIFLNHRHPLWSYGQSGFFEDIFTLMDQNPTTHRDDFFSNILDAFTVNGALYVFPFNFGFEYVGINASLPTAFIDAFLQLDSISYTQALQMYLDLQAGYADEMEHLKLADAASFIFPLHMLWNISSGFIDFVQGISRLNTPDFVLTLELLQQMYVDNPPPQVVYTGGSIQTLLDPQRNPAQYVFSVLSAFPGSLYALFPPESSHFLHYIPLADESGRPILLNMSHQPTQMVSIAQGPHSALAWEFVQHLIPAFTATANTPPRPGRTIDPTMSMYTPIVRSLFHEHFTTVFQTYQERWGVRPMRFPERQDAALERLLAYNQMPIVPIPWVPTELLSTSLERLMQGVISPQEAAQQMHNAVSLWLIE